MEFLAIVVALLCYQVWGSAGPLQEDDWFYRLEDVLASFNPVLGLALVVLLPVVVAQGLLNAIDDVLFGLPWIGLAAVMLLYSFGRGDIQALMGHYRRQCRYGDFAGAYLSILPELGYGSEEEGPGTSREVHALAQRGFFYAGYERWFPVLFYFLVLGPAGALAYRLLQLHCQRNASDIVLRVLFLADWVPARLLAFSFALIGDFVKSRDALFHSVQDLSEPADELLYSVGMAAFGMEPTAVQDDDSFGEQAATQNEECGNLLSRSAACWVAIAAVVVLLG